jgi:hypothetical protein
VVTDGGWTTERLDDDFVARFAEANRLGDVRWAYVTPHGTLVGFPNGTSRIVGDPSPRCRPTILKKKYRAG